MQWMPVPQLPVEHPTVPPAPPEPEPMEPPPPLPPVASRRCRSPSPAGAAAARTTTAAPGAVTAGARRTAGSRHPQRHRAGDIGGPCVQLSPIGVGPSSRGRTGDQPNTEQRHQPQPRVSHHPGSLVPAGRSVQAGAAASSTAFGRQPSGDGGGTKSWKPNSPPNLPSRPPPSRVWPPPCLPPRPHPPAPATSCAS